MSAISKNGFNFASAALGMILILNIATADDVTTNSAAITSQTNPLNTITPSSHSPVQDTTTVLPTTNQTTTTLRPNISTTIAPTLVSCQDAEAQNVNASLFTGVWFEVARKTNASIIESCNEFNFENENNRTSVISIFRDNDWVNKSNIFEINLVQGVFNITDKDEVNTYKILYTDYEKFAYVCSYRVNTDQITTTVPTTTIAPTTTTVPTTRSPISTTTTQATSTNTTAAPSPSKPESTNTAFILVRERSINSTYLKELSDQAQSKYFDFKNLTTVLQSAKCTNGASTLMPMLSIVMAVALAIFFKP